MSGLVGSQGYGATEITETLELTETLNSRSEEGNGEIISTTLRQNATELSDQTKKTVSEDIATNVNQVKKHQKIARRCAGIAGIIALGLIGIALLASPVGWILAGATVGIVIIAAIVALIAFSAIAVWHFYKGKSLLNTISEGQKKLEDNGSLSTLFLRKFTVDVENESREESINMMLCFTGVGCLWVAYRHSRACQDPNSIYNQDEGINMSAKETQDILDGAH